MRDIDKGDAIFIPTPQHILENKVDGAPVPDIIVRPGTTSESPIPGFKSGIVFIAPKPPLTETSAAELARKIGHISRHDN